LSEDAAAPKPRWSVAPLFIVDDVVTTANFYRDKLGFHYDRFWGDPPGFAMVRRARVTIMLKRFPKRDYTSAAKIAKSVNC
jgi:catechol 2,3-dioxygenase-like lactoylglutathione lyase family enzyme